MNKRFTRLLRSMLALSLAALILCSPVSVLAVTNQSLAVPLYEPPGKSSFWDDIRNAGSASVPFVVANPSNGPGGQADPLYTDALAKNTMANVRTLGYIQTNYQARNFKDAYNDIDAWYRMYPQTKGIYIDLIKQGGQAEVCYAAALYSHIKNIRPNDLVVLGAGTHLSTAYEPYGDIFANANSDYSTYRSWRTQYKGFENKTDYQNRFWHIIYGTSPENYNEAFAEARNNNAGWVYITDKTVPAPFAGTPSYWQNEASDVGAVPASSIPNRGKTFLPPGCISLSAAADNTMNTTIAKQSLTDSKTILSNISNTYDSEPATNAQLLGLPKGATLTTLTGQGWSCNTTTRSCTYQSAIAASSSVPPLGTTIQTTCDYGGGDATLRLTNYAGNRWDTTIPIRAPFGCDKSTPAGKINADTSGQITSLTTQSIETTPEITPLGGTDIIKQAPKKEVKAGVSPLKIVAIMAIGIIVIGLVIWGIYLWRKRARYSVKL